MLLAELIALLLQRLLQTRRRPLLFQLGLQLLELRGAASTHAQ
jgi:hypothetical protein